MCGKALILIHTASRESQGRVVPEAMAARMPVVAYDVGGMHESLVHTRTGFLAPFGDVSALAGYLERLASYPHLRHQLGENGYHRVRELFTTDQTAKRVTSLIDAVLQRSNQPRFQQVHFLPGVTRSTPGP